MKKTKCYPETFALQNIQIVMSIEPNTIPRFIAGPRLEMTCRLFSIVEIRASATGIMFSKIVMKRKKKLMAFPNQIFLLPLSKYRSK